MKKQSKNKIKELGMVFTPNNLVNDILDKLPQDLFSKNKTFLDNSCGDGAFLCEVLKRKMKNGYSHLEALRSIYGVELDPVNVKKCKENLLLGNKDENLILVLDQNIINADALDKYHKGWELVGYYWEKIV